MLALAPTPRMQALLSRRFSPKCKNWDISMELWSKKHLTIRLNAFSLLQIWCSVTQKFRLVQGSTILKSPKSTPKLQGWTTKVTLVFPSTRIILLTT